MNARAAGPELAVYTVAEVAVLLGLSLAGTYALIRSGEIPAKKMGGRWIIPSGRFHSWLDTDQGEKTYGPSDDRSAARA
jgi:excisionase family DNA binding protein